MSSIIFLTDETQAFVATDTLATNVDGKPRNFTSKALYLPHLRTILAVTGAGEILALWATCVNGMRLRGIDALDALAPTAIEALWQRARKELRYPEHWTGTVYHFGVSEQTGNVKAFAYRSTNGFQSEPIPGEGRVGRKPECSLGDNPAFPADLMPMMTEQRAIQAERPEAERIHIGGEIMVHHLTQDGHCTIYIHDRFQDFDLHEQLIYRAGNPPA